MRIFRTGIWIRRPGPGFTLLEIVVVLLIIGLLLLLIYPKIGSLAEGDLRRASRQLAGTIQHYYQESMATRQIYRLSFDLESDAYEVHVLDSGTRRDTPPVAGLRVGSLPRGVYFQDVVTLHQGKVSEGKAFTQFFPAGFAERAVIHLMDQKQRGLTLEINPFTGRVRIHDGYVEISRSAG